MFTYYCCGYLQVVWDQVVNKGARAGHCFSFHQLPMSRHWGMVYCAIRDPGIPWPNLTHPHPITEMMRLLQWFRQGARGSRHGTDCSRATPWATNGATNGLNCDGREQKSYGAMAQCPKKKRQNLMVQNFIIPIYSRNSWCFCSMQKQIASHRGVVRCIPNPQSLGASMFEGCCPWIISVHWMLRTTIIHDLGTNLGYSDYSGCLGYCTWMILSVNSSSAKSWSTIQRCNMQPWGPSRILAQRKSLPSISKLVVRIVAIVMIGRRGIWRTKQRSSNNIYNMC